jgi:ATP-dependent DNA helicase RecG
LYDFFYHIYKGLTDRAKVGNRLRIFGEVRVGARGLEMYHPEIQLITEHTPLPQTGDMGFRVAKLEYL